MRTTHALRQPVNSDVFCRISQADFQPLSPSLETSGPDCPRHEVRRHRGGFTLVEMLVVITIVTVLLSMAANTAQEVVEANQLTTAGEMVTDELRLARQTARSRDRVVEVRFFKRSGASSFGGEPIVDSFQVYMFDQDNATATPLGEIRNLPGSVKVSENADLSTLMTENRIKNDWKTGDEQVPLSDGNTEYTAYRVRFLPDGRTDLDTQKIWFLTLHGRNARESPPSNYVTVQIKPARGNVRSFWPQ